MIKKARVSITEDDIRHITQLLRSSGHPDIVKPITGSQSSKIVVTTTAPSDNPNAMAYVSTNSDDINFVLPNIDQAINDALKKYDTKGMSVRKIIDARDDARDETTRAMAKTILSIFAGTTAHEIAHLSDKKHEGGDTSKPVIELGSEQRAEAEGDRIMKETIRQASINVESELKKLASKLDDLGETSFVKDVYRIASMLPKEEQKSTKALAKKDLDLLQRDLERLFKR